MGGHVTFRLFTRRAIRIQRRPLRVENGEAADRIRHVVGIVRVGECDTWRRPRRGKSIGGTYFKCEHCKIANTAYGSVKSRTAF